MRVLAVVHHEDAAAGVFAQPTAAEGHELVEWLPHEAPPPALAGFGAALVLGAEAQVDQEESYPWLRAEKEVVRELLAAGTPTLGICFGSQLLADALGAVVGPAPQPEIGWHEIQLTAEGRSDPVLGGLPDRFDGFGYHHYEWSLPPGAVELARSERSLQGFRLERRPVWGLQFHPEVTHGDLCSWLDDWQGDSGAVATGLDPDVIRMQSAARIEGWNDIGRAIAQRFLAAAGEARAGQPAGRTR